MRDYLSSYTFAGINLMECPKGGSNLVEFSNDSYDLYVNANGNTILSIKFTILKQYIHNVEYFTTVMPTNEVTDILYPIDSSELNGVLVNNTEYYTRLRLTYRNSENVVKTITFYSYTFQVSFTDDDYASLIPYITLPNDFKFLQYGTPYSYSDVTAYDPLTKTDITHSITIQTNLDIYNFGTYDVTFNVTNTSGYIAESKTQYVIVQDTVKPEIVLNGDTSITVRYKETFEDPGASAYDDVFGDITQDIQITGNVDTNNLGDYILEYNVIDACGNEAISKTRTIHVIDDISPTITLNGETNIILSHGTTFDDPGATAYDIFDGDITNLIIAESDVDENIVGMYSILYTVQDSNSNEASVSRSVVVVDTSSPLLTLNGLQNIYIDVFSDFTDPGASAYDVVDGDITSSIQVYGYEDVDSSVVGNYVIRYVITDSAGNTTSKERTIYVQDNEKPVITLNGESTVSVKQHTQYVDDGANAVDNYDGNITSKIVIDNVVNTEELGTYCVVYNVTDENGNEAETVVRTVVVIENEHYPKVIIPEFEISSSSESSKTLPCDNHSKTTSISSQSTLEGKPLPYFCRAKNYVEKAQYNGATFEYIQDATIVTAMMNKTFESKIKLFDEDMDLYSVKHDKSLSNDFVSYMSYEKRINALSNHDSLNNIFSGMFQDVLPTRYESKDILDGESVIATEIDETLEIIDNIKSVKLDSVNLSNVDNPSSSSTPRKHKKYSCVCDSLTSEHKNEVKMSTGLKYSNMIRTRGKVSVTTKSTKRLHIYNTLLQNDPTQIKSLLFKIGLRKINYHMNNLFKSQTNKLVTISIYETYQDVINDLSEKEIIKLSTI